MATQTTNLNLVKPDYTDAADIAVINTNMDTIDSHVHGNDVDIAGIATIIKGTTNNSGHSISSGEYFIANGAKYKATATIGTGVTWSDKATSVSDHDLINALNGNIATFSTSVPTSGTKLYKTATFKRIGSLIACVYVSGLDGLTNGMTNTVLAIPSGFVPKSSQEVFVTTGFGEHYKLNFSLNGNLEVYPYSGVSDQHNVIVTFTYPLF